MAIFPEVIPDYGYSFYPRFKTTKLGPTDGDITQRRRMRSTTLYTAELSYKSLTSANERLLIEFFETHYGDYSSFTFFDIVSRVYTGVSLGTGNGSTTVFTMDARDATDLTVNIDGSPTSAYTQGDRTGANGQDQITFNSAPANNTVLTIDYTGEKYCANCFFRDNTMKSVINNFQRHQIAKIIIDQESS